MKNDAIRKCIELAFVDSDRCNSDTTILQAAAFGELEVIEEAMEAKEVEMINDNGINNRAAAPSLMDKNPTMLKYMIPFSEWTKDANQVIATARSYVRSIANLSIEDASSVRKAVELANELLSVLDAAPYGQ